MTMSISDIKKTIIQKLPTPIIEVYTIIKKRIHDYPLRERKFTGGVKIQTKHSMLFVMTMTRKGFLLL